MRLSALTPQFVHETPEDPKGDSARVIAFSEESRGRVRAKGASPEASDSLAEETKAGLRRLSRLIREHSSRDETEDERRERAPTSNVKRALATKARVDEEAVSSRPEPLDIKSYFVYVGAADRITALYARARDIVGAEETRGQFLNRDV